MKIQQAIVAIHFGCIALHAVVMQVIVDGGGITKLSHSDIPVFQILSLTIFYWGGFVPLFASIAMQGIKLPLRSRTLTLTCGALLHGLLMYLMASGGRTEDLVGALLTYSILYAFYSIIGTCGTALFSYVIRMKVGED